MNRNRSRIASLLMMILIIVVALTVTAYAAVVVPPTVSLPTANLPGAATGYKSVISQNPKPSGTAVLQPKSTYPSGTAASPAKSGQPSASTTPLPEFILPPASASSPPESVLPEKPTTTQQPDMPAEDITPPDAAVPLTPDGNLTLIDDINGTASESKQFLTVTTKTGNTFYLVIDRAANKDNVYFLNLVDEADLLALIKDKGSLVGASGDDAVPATPEPSGNPYGNPNSLESVKPVTSPEPTADEAKHPDKTTAYFALGLIVLLLLAGGSVWFFKLRKPKKPAGSRSYLDEYDFGDEEDASFNPDERTSATKYALDLDRLPETDFQTGSEKDGRPEHNDDYINKFDNIGKNPRKQEENPR